MGEDVVFTPKLFYEVKVEVHNTLAFRCLAYGLGDDFAERDEIFINASWGIGEAVVSEEVAGDEYIVNRISKNIKIQRIGNKDIEYVLQPKGTKRIQVATNKRIQQCLSEEQIQKLASIGLKLEEHFGFPQDMN